MKTNFKDINLILINEVKIIILVIILNRKGGYFDLLS